MTAHRDPDRLIHDFVLEGAERLHDQVYDAVRADIERRPQRVVIGPWRMPTLNKLVPLGLGTAAAVVALIVGARLLAPPTTSVAGPGVGSSPTPATSVATPASPVATPSSSTSSATGLPRGSSHVLWYANAGVAMTVTIPAAGWFGNPGEGILTKNDNADPPDGAGMIVFPDGDAWRVPGDPCRWQSTMPAAASGSVEELVAALSTQASRDASPAVATTVDGHAGKSITLHVPSDAVLPNCDRGEFCTLINAGGTDCVRYHQGPGQIDVLWIVKVNTALVVIDAAHYAATPPEHVTELEAIVSSVTFG